MTSFVVINTDKEKRAAYIQNYCQTLAINLFDITTVEREVGGKQNAQSIGIDAIKAIHGKIFLKPLKSKTKAVIIEEAHLLTIEAQNALLKVLEEPPQDTIILLSSESKEQLLPTIISRCQIIELKQEQRALSEEGKKEYEEFIAQLSELSIGERLKKAELLAKDKDQALAWIENLILVLREELLTSVILGRSKRDDSRIDSEAQPEGPEAKLFMLQRLKSFQKLHTIVKTTNANPRFAIEHTLLQA